MRTSPRRLLDAIPVGAPALPAAGSDPQWTARKRRPVTLTGAPVSLCFPKPLPGSSLAIAPPTPPAGAGCIERTKFKLRSLPAGTLCGGLCILRAAYRLCYRQRALGGLIVWPNGRPTRKPDRPSVSRVPTQIHGVGKRGGLFRLMQNIPSHTCLRRNRVMPRIGDFYGPAIESGARGCPRPVLAPGR